LSPRSARSGCLPWRRSPVGVHHVVSTQRFRRPGPAVQPPSVRPSGVQCVQCPARPVSGRLVSTRPVVSRVLSAPVGPDASISSHLRRWRWGPGRGSGQPVTIGSGRVPVGCRILERLDGRPSRAGRGRRCPGRVGRWGVGAGSGPGWGRRRPPRLPAERPGRPGRRAEHPSRRLRCGAREQAAARGGRHGRAAAVVGWVGDHGGWWSRGLTPGGRTRRGPLDVPTGWACGPSAAQAYGERSRLATGSALTCGNGWWACQDLNLGPHPERKIARVMRRGVRG
jgi:hypothetical protein